jgi:hypothetical protein
LRLEKRWAIVAVLGVLLGRLFTLHESKSAAGTSALTGTPTDFLEPLEAAHHEVKGQADQSDDGHPGDDEIVPLAGVARIVDQVAEPERARTGRL